MALEKNALGDGSQSKAADKMALSKEDPLPPAPSTPPEDCCCYFPRRYMVISLLACGMFVVHAMRVNLAVTVVTILDEAPHEKVGTYGAALNLPDVTWDSIMIGFLHAAFYIGYLITQLPAGYLATKLPPHRLFGAGILVSCSLNLTLPLAINASSGSYVTTCVIRVLQGLAEGLLFPSCYAVMRHWTIPEERSRMGALTLTGVYLGPVAGLAMSGYLTHYHGWQYTYYLHGGVGILWCVVWLFMSYEKPAFHPWMSADERKMIEARQGETAVIYADEKVPWKAIVTSLPVQALNVANFARSFVFFMLLTNEPAYINAFDYSIAENGIYSALPHALMASVAILSGPLADQLVYQRHLSRTQVRKLFTGLGFGLEGACMYALAVITDGTAAIAFLTLGVGISGLTISGWQINHLDLAPRYASILVAISTAVGTVAGILSPVIIGEMTQIQSLDNWHHVFALTGSVLVFSVIVYSVFGSGELQPWAEPRVAETVINPLDPLEKKPYGTFPAQIDHNDFTGSDNSVAPGCSRNIPSDTHDPDNTGLLADQTTEDAKLINGR